MVSAGRVTVSPGRSVAGHAEGGPVLGRVEWTDVSPRTGGKAMWRPVRCWQHGFDVSVGGAPQPPLRVGERDRRWPALPDELVEAQHQTLCRGVLDLPTGRDDGGNSSLQQRAGEADH